MLFLQTTEEGKMNLDGAKAILKSALNLTASYRLVLMTGGEEVDEVAVNSEDDGSYYSVTITNPEALGQDLPEQPLWQIVIKGDHIYHDATILDDTEPLLERRKRKAEGERALVTLETILKKTWIVSQDSKRVASLLEFVALLKAMEQRHTPRDGGEER